MRPGVALMGWESRRYDANLGEGGGGRFRAVLRRIFGDGENPLAWSIPLYTAWGIRVRIHLVFIIMIIAELIRSIPQSGMGPVWMATGMASLFVLVLLHEYGHCVACRWVGGEADQILMWPLGGLAYASPPHHWKAELITVLGGPAVNVLLWPVFGAAVALLAGPSLLLFNPFDPGQWLLDLTLAGTADRTVLMALGWLYYTNLVLLAFNMLVPMYPLDAGRTLYTLLWRRSDERSAMQTTITVGFVAAIALAVIAVVWSQTILLGVAIWGGLTCWLEKRRLAMIADDPALAGYDFSRGYGGLPADEEPVSAAAKHREEKRRQKEAEEQAELDRILAKISAQGKESLTGRERRTLHRATERRRNG